MECWSDRERGCPTLYSAGLPDSIRFWGSKALVFELQAHRHEEWDKEIQ